jgi:aryl-alcohol dehydrogenase-like predicted oxidoreductase
MLRGMNYRRLGQSGLKVSPLCLGAMTFGEADEHSFMHKVSCDEATAHTLMSKAIDAGINFIDTADVYGQDGLAERVVGRWFAQTGRRDQVVLATKCRFRMGDGPNGTGASRLRVVRAADASLRRLQTDRIDLYQVHMQDIDTPEEETLRALDDLVRAGKVLYIGASNYAAYRLADSQWISRAQSLERYVSLQVQYSLVERAVEREHVPLCLHHGLGILPWSPLGGGFLSGKYQRDQTPPTGTRLDHWRDRFGSFDSEGNWQALATVRAVAAELGTTPARVAIAWLLHKPVVSSVIFGARSVAQLEDNLPAAELALPAAAQKRLDDATAPKLGYPYDFIARIQPTW